MGSIEINDKFKTALQVMDDTKRSVFVTGKAGTGKSTLLDHFRHTTKKKVVALASTGVAALNIRGQTIHSFFRFKPDITLEKARELGRDTKKKQLYQALDAIVVDEISMVRADLLDCVDVFLRAARKQKEFPFGGVQMIFVGDLYQLPPVVSSQERRAFSRRYQTNYFFSADVLRNNRFDYIELEKIYRQSDTDFIKILNAIRNNTIDDDLLSGLNKRVDANFQPSEDDLYVYLTPTNSHAQQINEERLDRLAGKIIQYEGYFGGAFDERQLPTDQCLKLKIGAQVMLVNNDRRERWVNGSIGKIIKLAEENGEPCKVELVGGEKVSVEPYTWELFSYHYDAGSRSLKTDVVGSFTQYPLKLAWAITIHKSQGKTFKKVIIDMGRGAFAHGQTYVALSRCVSIEGLVLKKPISVKHIFLDYNVVKFVTGYQYALAEENFSAADKINLIKQAIANDQRLEMLYLKAADEKSKRIIKPHSVGEMEYGGKKFTGVNAFCFSRQEDRVFRVDRILDIKIV